MKMHFTGYFDRRVKGKNFKPLVFLLLETILLVLVAFIISSLEVKIVTILCVFLVLYFVIVSSLPRYLRSKNRQKKDYHIYNNMDNI